MFCAQITTRTCPTQGEERQDRGEEAADGEASGYGLRFRARHGAWRRGIWRAAICHEEAAIVEPAAQRLVPYRRVRANLNGAFGAGSWSRPRQLAGMPARARPLGYHGGRPSDRAGQRMGVVASRRRCPGEHAGDDCGGPPRPPEDDDVAADAGSPPQASTAAVDLLFGQDRGFVLCVGNLPILTETTQEWNMRDAQTKPMLLAGKQVRTSESVRLSYSTRSSWYGTPSSQSPPSACGTSGSGRV